MHDDIKSYSPEMLALLTASVADAVHYCNDVAEDCGDDLEEVARAMNPRAVYESSIQMFANRICPGFTFVAAAVPESVKLALRRIVLERIVLTY